MKTHSDSPTPLFDVSTHSHFDFFIKKLTTLVMKDGKKIKASNVVFTMFQALKKKIELEGDKKSLKEGTLDTVQNSKLLVITTRALQNITPTLEVRKVRVSGSTYLVPSIVSKKKQETLALKWLVEAAKKRQQNSKSPFSKCLADELLDASRKLGFARQKRDELHRLAQLNRAYIRYRWW